MRSILLMIIMVMTLYVCSGVYAAQPDTATPVKQDLLTTCSMQVNKTKTEALKKTPPRMAAKLQFTLAERNAIHECVDSVLSQNGEVKGFEKEKRDYLNYRKKHPDIKNYKKPNQEKEPKP